MCVGEPRRLCVGEHPAMACLTCFLPDEWLPFSDRETPTRVIVRAKTLRWSHRPEEAVPRQLQGHLSQEAWAAFLTDYLSIGTALPLLPFFDFAGRSALVLLFGLIFLGVGRSTEVQK